MHSLLQRQLRKKLPEDLRENASLLDFLQAVDQSYTDFDDKLNMLQRATTISSQELSEANKELLKDATKQQMVLQSLEQAIVNLNLNLDIEPESYPVISEHFNVQKLADHIKHLALKITQVNKEKDILFRALEAQNDSLNNYIQIVSHDLKSPLRNINALMSWILEEEKEGFSEESKINSSLVSQNIFRMEKLISGVLEHATIGDKSENKSEVSIESLLIELKSILQIPETVQLSWQDNLPTLHIEKIWIEKLFYHLIKNAVIAVKDNNKPKITVEYKCNEFFHQFSIKDNGVGIARRYHNIIFEIFQKLDNETTAAGVGLALSKKIVGMYEGTIDLESIEGEGTTFFFTLKKNS